MSLKDCSMSSRANNRSQVRRFLEDVSVWINGCWQWIGYTNKKNGYGCTWYNQKRILAHRFMWELMNDQTVPEGMVVMHTCDNPLCVNPYHLQLGTQRDNIIDMISKDRNNHPKGTKHHRYKVTHDMIKEAKKLKGDGKSAREVGDILGIGHSTAGHIMAYNSRYQIEEDQLNEVQE